MGKINVKEIVEDVIKKLTDEKKDGYLLEIDANERSITHKLAEYLQKEKVFSEYHVDCEYNRKKDKNKSKNSLPVPAKRNTKRKLVVPDIIIHKRGDCENNLLVIESTKSSHSKEKKLKDEDKLKDYTEYDYMLFIEFYVKSKYKKNKAHPYTFKWIEKTLILTHSL